MTAWFVGYNTGDFHLWAAGQTTFADIAEWSDGDPSVDIDGEPRATSTARPSLTYGASRAT